MSDNKFGSSIILKLVIIGFLIIILMIPMQMIGSLVDERRDRRDEATHEVGAKWGREQVVAGPILTVPYYDYNIQNKNEIKTIKYINFLPEELKINGKIFPKLLNRGIYDVATYNGDLNLSGKFLQPDFKNFGISEDNVIWEGAVVSVGISDMRGIKDNLKIDWNGQKIYARSGLEVNVPGINAGVNMRVPLDNTQKIYNYSLAINLNGTKTINFLPLGNETNVELTSDWPTPSFGGAFLPDERQVDKTGFTAKWKVLQLNRSYSQSWLGNNAGDLLSSAFGVDLLVTVDEYQKTSRSVKYAIMIIALTFLIFFFIEILNKIRIHPIQYILVGLALVLFFSLLLAMSEHINFNLAYLVSALATLFAVTLYAKNIFKSLKISLLQSLFLAIIYIFIFVIIQLQDYALLVGNIGLFVILAGVMFVSRKIDWYSVRSKNISE